jgi:Tfp pilus assembly protein PilN
LSQGLSSLIQDRPAIALNCDRDAVDGVLVSGGRFAHRMVRGDSPDSMVQAVVQTLSSAMRVPADKLALVCEGADAGSVFPDLVPVAFPPPRDFDAVAIPGFGAIAAALAGFYSRTSANVLPAALQYRTSQLRLIPTYVLSVLLFLVCGALLLRDTYQTYVFSKEVDAAITAITPAVRELGRQETELNGLLEKERVLFSDIGKPDPMADVMTELTRVMPRDSWLAGYTLQGNALTLTGYSERATDVQKLLEDSSLFRDVQFSSPITKEDGKDRFVIRTVLEEVQ